MTLAEANMYFRGWEESPPTFVLVRAIAEGLGGEVRQPTEAEKAVEAAGADVERTLTEISVRSRGSVPVTRGKDLGLPKIPPAFDLDEMRRRNAERVLMRHKARIAARG